MKKKVILLCTAAAMVAVLAVGGTLAYLQDRTVTAENTFMIGEVKGKLTENGETTAEGDPLPGGETDNKFVDWDKETDSTEDNAITDLAPGQTVQKKPVVQNTGKNAAYVRLTVGNAGTDDADFDIEGLDEANWTLHTDGNYYYIGGEYDGVLAPGEETSALFTGVKLKADATYTPPGKEITVTVYAELIQANYLADLPTGENSSDNAAIDAFTLYDTTYEYPTTPESNDDDDTDEDEDDTEEGPTE